MIPVVNENDAIVTDENRFGDNDTLAALVANLIEAAVRTNVYQRPERPVFSIKIDSSRVEGLPSPRPMYEIFLHSRRLEGIHLRGGRVARGGIRWSDRHDDYRTEILGLMKAQMVKNAVIVPVGAKGGFVAKRPTGLMSPDETRAEVVEALIGAILASGETYGSPDEESTAAVEHLVRERAMRA